MSTATMSIMISEATSVGKDCPICMEMVEISPPVNCLVTECGHTFHTSCFLNNVLHNGFGCPYCRRMLVDEEQANEVRRREIERQRNEEDDIFNQGFYDEDEDDDGEYQDLLQQQQEQQDMANIEMDEVEVVGGPPVRNWLTEGLMEQEIVGGDGDEGMMMGVGLETEYNQNLRDMLEGVQQRIVEAGLDEWAEGERTWNRERRIEERAFLGMRLMFRNIGDAQEGGGFWRDTEWFDWMDSQNDDDYSDYDENEQEQAQEQVVAVQEVVDLTEDDDEDEDEDTESEAGGFDELMEREHQLSRNNELPSPYDLAIELQRYGFYMIDYIRIILDTHYQEEYRGIIGDYNSRHNIDSLRTSIARLMQQYREEARIEQEMEMNMMREDEDEDYNERRRTWLRRMGHPN